MDLPSGMCQSLSITPEKGAEEGFRRTLMSGYDENLKSAGKDEESDYFEAKPRVGLAERMAVRAGFNAPKLNTDGIRSNSLGSFEGQSSFLTIPPGLSPTSFLESPVFLSNSLVQPSPTTGKIELDQSTSTSDSFVFKPLGEVKQNSNAGSNVPLTLYPPQSGMSVTKPSTQSGSPSGSPDPGAGVASTGDLSDSFIGDEVVEFGEGENKGESCLITSGLPSEDGFNWRKYGQKQVKGSEFPRSYYKCTHNNCQAKKKVERSLEGVTTDITYNGTHNHPMPASQGRRLSFGSALVSLSDAAVTTVDESEPQSLPPPLDEHKQVSEGFLYEPGGFDLQSNLSNEDDERGGGAEEELESKRRRVDLGSMEMGGASRAVREPRVVVQTTSEVDILDDGYRWRKYGQKVVKGNPNPRSYYKCTNPGCTVRKHVERASHDLKSVITTYEGKHNHDVPAVRSSSQSGNGLSGCSGGPITASGPQVNRRPSPVIQSFDGPSRSLPPHPLPPLGPFSQSGFPLVGQSTMWAFRQTNGWPGGYRQHEDPASAAGQFGSGAPPLERGWFRDTQG